MSHSFPIIFTPPRIARVNLAIEPFDAFTGQIVQQRVQVWLTARADAPERERLPVRIIRNARGQFIMVDLPDGTQYFVHVRLAGTHYLEPDVVEVEAPAPPDDDAGPDHAGVRVNRLLRVALYPAPSFPFFLWPEATLIRGRVVRSSGISGQPQPVGRARLWIDLPAAAGPAALPFATLTDAAGSFALPIRLPPVIGADTPEPVPVTLHVFDEDRSGNPPAPAGREITFSVRDGRTHTLQPAIDVSDSEAVGLASEQRGRVRLRGVIVRSEGLAAARPVARARISIETSPDESSATWSDEFGRFALTIRLRAGEGTSTPAQITLRLRDDNRFDNPPSPIERTLSPFPVLEGRSYVAQSPIDLAGTDTVPFVND